MANSEPTLRTGLASAIGAEALVAIGVFAMVFWNLDAVFARLDIVAHFFGFH